MLIRVHASFRELSQKVGCVCCHSHLIPPATNPIPEPSTDLPPPPPSSFGVGRCEVSAEDIQEDSEGWLQVYPEGLALQCHLGLGTYTLTLPARQGKKKEKDKDKKKEKDKREEGVSGDRQRCESRLLKDEVEELRRLVQIHKEQKVRSRYLSHMFLILYTFLHCVQCKVC